MVEQTSLLINVQHTQGYIGATSYTAAAASESVPSQTCFAAVKTKLRGSTKMTFFNVETRRYAKFTGF